MKTKIPRSKWFWILLIVICGFAVARITIGFFDEPEVKNADLSKIMSEIDDPKAKDKIDKVTMLEDSATVGITYKDEDKQGLASFYPLEYGDTIVERAEEADLKINVKSNEGLGILDTLNTFLPLIILIALFYFIFVGMGSLGGSGYKVSAVSEIPKTRFKDVAGAKEAVEDIQEITDFLKAPEKFHRVGAKSPKGALLVGPPGTGKTLLARAVAGEAGVPFYSASGSDFLDMFVGTGSRRIRKLFEEANKNSPSIIFIDEIDAVGGKRSSSTKGADQEHNRTINTLLTQMDGFEESNVIVLAATNDPGKLDSALVRPGRFDRKIVVDLPDWAGRLGILKVHSEGKPLAEDVRLDLIAKSTTGLAGADLANLINEALINAARHERTAATQEDFVEALSVVTIGRARKSRVMTENDKKVAAVHEAGHTVVALALENLPDPTHVTIIPRGMSGGHTKLQESEDQFQNSSLLKSRIAMMMGGLVAEKTVFGDITQGPGHDLESATNLANKMVTKMGMGSKFATYNTDGPILGGHSEKVQEEIELIVNDGIEKADEVISDGYWRKVLDMIVEKLLLEDSLEYSELQEIKESASLEGK